MVQFEQIETDLSERILTVTLNRPARLNAWTPTMARELIEAFDRADADDEVRAVIVTGAGRAFCAGADLAGGGETFAGRGGALVEKEPGADGRAGAEGPSGSEGRPTDGLDGEKREVPRDNGGQVVLRMWESTKPIVAAINGPAVGVGATMTLPMDVRLASEDARIGFVFVRRGIVPEACSSWFLPRIVGIGQALEWAMTGRVFSAKEGLEGGLLRSVHPAGELLDASRGLALEIAENTAPVSVALARQMLWRMLGASHPMLAHRSDSRGMLYRGRSGDAAEGITAFLEKRPAVFQDRVSDGLPDVFPGWSAPEFE
jgi:enoyl-CoA hydratase/carnithine racemase